MRKALTAMTLLLVVGNAFAASVAYDTQAAFMADVQPGYYLEDFGAPAVSDIAPATFTDGTYSWTATAGDDIYIWGSDFAGGTPCVGSLGTNGPDFAITITFGGAPVTAFGGNLYITDQYFGPMTGDLTVALDDGTSVLLDSPYSDTFTGFTSDVAIASVTLTGGLGTYVTIDNIVAGAAIPEPTSLILLGLGALAALRRR